jgi:hypothetical protein
MLNSKGNNRGMHDNHTKGVDSNLYKHGLRKHPLYTRWGDIKHRCYNVNNKRYKHYGAKGYGMLQEWREDFVKFHDYCIDNGWGQGLVIARLNDTGNYEPGNIKFITAIENTKEMNARLCNSIRLIEKDIVFINQHEAARYIIANSKSVGKEKTISSNIGRAIQKNGIAYGYSWEVVK